MPLSWLHHWKDHIFLILCDFNHYRNHRILPRLNTMPSTQSASMYAHMPRRIKKNPKQQHSPPHVSENTTLVGYMWATETAKFDFQSYRTSVVFTKTKKNATTWFTHLVTPRPAVFCIRPQKYRKRNLLFNKANPKSHIPSSIARCKKKKTSHAESGNYQKQPP